MQHNGLVRSCHTHTQPVRTSHTGGGDPKTPTPLPPHTWSGPATREVERLHMAK